jgi:L-amino acid N-acyltransferase YncA
MPSESLLIRPSAEADLPAITAIYAHAVVNGTGTFELDVPVLAEMARRRAEVVARNLPWLVAVLGGALVGYAYASPFRPRGAYRYCVEDSVYLDPAAQQRGVGTWLLQELISRCQALGMRQMLAAIGDSQNQGSVALHRRLGFEPAGHLSHVGWKCDRWLDVVFLQRSLGLGATQPPENAA